jgi:hypothetical protein
LVSARYQPTGILYKMELSTFSLSGSVDSDIFSLSSTHGFDFVRQTTIRHIRAVENDTISRFVLRTQLSSNLYRCESKENRKLAAKISSCHHPSTNVIFQVYGAPTVG